MAKKHGLPVGVGGHSLQVPIQCEKAGVPCDFYVKTLHSDDYPSATPKELRKEFIWLDGGKGWYDNMWCINPEETIEFMKTVDQALDRLQGAGGRGDPAGPGVSLRLQERGRLHRRGHVRLPDQGRRRAGRAGDPPPPEAGAALAGLNRDAAQARQRQSPATRFNTESALTTSPMPRVARAR